MSAYDYMIQKSQNNDCLYKLLVQRLLPSSVKKPIIEACISLRHNTSDICVGLIGNTRSKGTPGVLKTCSCLPMANPVGPLE